jgi:hypothetical protein
MFFILGTLYFVCVVGALDARLPWPKAKAGSSGHDA